MMLLSNALEYIFWRDSFLTIHDSTKLVEQRHFYYCYSSQLFFPSYQGSKWTVKFLSSHTLLLLIAASSAVSPSNASSSATAPSIIIHQPLRCLNSNRSAVILNNSQNNSDPNTESPVFHSNQDDPLVKPLIVEKNLSDIALADKYYNINNVRTNDSYEDISLKGLDYDDISSLLSSTPSPYNKNTILIKISENYRAVVIVILTASCLCILGILHAIKLTNQLWQRCRCKLCRKEYSIVRQLGSGGFGNVYLAQQHTPHYYCHFNKKGINSQNALFVLKKVCVDDITENDSSGLEGRRLSSLCHPFMTKYYDDFLHQEFELGRGVVASAPKCFCIVLMEYYSGGDLGHVIENRWDSLVESQVRKWIYQVASALEFLHSKNILHRDVKSSNIFLAENGTARLGDLGLCRYVPATTTKKKKKKEETSRIHLRKLRSMTGRKEKNQYTANIITTAHYAEACLIKSENKESILLSQAGTTCYMAPEMFDEGSGHYGKPSDVWGLGCVLLELLSGQFMWEINCNDIIDDDSDNDYQETLSSQPRSPTILKDPTSSSTVLATAIQRNKRIAEKIVHKLVPNGISGKLKRLLIQMLHHDPNRRLTLSQLLKKKWFRNPVKVSKGGRYRVIEETSFGQMLRQSHDVDPSQKKILEKDF